MKFLPEDKKRRVWSLLILIVAVVGIAYFNFFAGTEGVSTPGPALSPSPDSAPSAGIKKSRGGLLPYGSEINLSILDKDDFRVLKASPPLTITAQEIGKDNPFE